MSLLKVQNVSLTRDGKKVLDNVSFALDEGEITTLIGPNGAGKTTLIRIVLGLQKATSGSIELKKGIRIGYMPQKLMIDFSLPLSVKAFLKLADNSTQAAKEALELVGVGHLMDSPMAHLSGGETQRVLLARALMRKPQLLVLDEPVQGVDVSGQEALYQLISSIRSNTNCAILMISHDLHLVMAATDQVLCLNHHLCCQGTPEVVSADPVYTELFGVRTALYTHHHDHEHGLHGEIKSEERGCNHG
jgi:zinc transport system ATP-binding protein